ncbi:hypothetical protein BHE74_00051921 [Ensete ventricosum]|nr:hypothetical protein GW17_00056582 [Ensete ventricosum]RWW42532.1 hypothetical protein BHE74_00051921 [Ensete ventricosum]
MYRSASGLVWVKRSYPILSLHGVLIVDVAAEPDNIEVLRAEGAGKLRAGVILASVELLEPKIQIYRTKQPVRKSHSRIRAGKSSLFPDRNPPHLSSREDWDPETRRRIATAARIGGASTRPRRIGSTNQIP